MHDRSPTESFDPLAPNPFRQCAPLPEWLARRLLVRDETIAWVVGPRASPWWEGYVTHPFLFLIALALAAACVGAGWLAAGMRPPVPTPALVAAAALVLGSIFILGIFSGHFTRLVVTNFRLLIVQGREVRRRWRVDELPPSLTRYVRQGAGAGGRSVDLDALRSMLGDPADPASETKSILALGKKLDQIQAARDNVRP
jgi:hypothetical protein